jgi:sporulation protein YlmC with PRC-barrel domain
VQTDIDPRDLIGHKAVDRNGDKIGTVDEVYLDDATGRPEWAAVRTGLFGRDAFVPLTSSEFISDELRVPFDKAQVKDSPDFGVGQHLSPAQELQLYRYYGLDLPNGDSGSAAADASKASSGPGVSPAATTAAQPIVTPPPAAAAATAAAATAAATTTTNGRAPIAPPAPTQVTPPAADTSRTAAFMAPAAPAPARAEPPAEPMPSLAKAAPRPDPLADPLADPLTGHTPGAAAPASSFAAPSPTNEAPLGDPARSGVPEPIEFVCREERLDISTEWRVLGQARLRKYVTAEQVERRVPVIRERIRVERVPVGAEEREQLTSQEISESTEEVTLHEQRVVVRKTTVPVERIRLVTERFTEEEIVRDELHREHIQVQDSTRPAGPTPVPGSGGQPMQPSAGSTPSSSTQQGRPDQPGHAIGA